MSEAENLLKKLPPRTPLWAVGVVTIIVSAAVSLGVLYTVGRGEIKDYMSNSFSITSRRLDAENTACNSILGLVQTGAQQVTELMQQNGKLNERITNLERDLVDTKVKLDDCRKSCLGGK